MNEIIPTPGQLDLLPDCVLPGCHNPVTSDGDACQVCVHEFGPMLRPGGLSLSRADIQARDRTVAAAYARRP